MTRPARLDADDDTGGDIRIRSRADHRAEMQVQVLAELQAAVRMGQRDRALDVVRHGLAGRVGNVVDRQDGDVVADSDPAVFAAVGPDLPSSAHVRSALTSAWS